jgi:hypothetical protein
LSLTLVFPSPFPLTLSGAVNLLKNSATFTGLPDIPLTNLGVTLNGGPDGLFLSTCQNPSGTATATMTDQNGDKTVTAPSNFTVSGCPSAGAGGSGGIVGGSSGGTFGGGGSRSGVGNGSSATGVTVGTTTLSKGGLTGLSAGHVSLMFTLRVARGAAKLRALIIEPPRGMSFVPARAGARPSVTGVTLGGAQIKSLAVSHGRLLIVLRKAVSRLIVRIDSTALNESATLRQRAGRLGSVLLTVIAENSKGRRTAIRVRITNLRR